MTKTIKSILALALSITMILSFATIGVSAYTTDTNGLIDYTLTIGNVQVAGDATTVSLPLTVDEGLGLSGMDLQIAYDSQYLQYDGFTAPTGFLAMDNLGSLVGTDRKSVV